MYYINWVMYDFDVIIKLLFAMSIKKYYSLDNLLYLSSAFGLPIIIYTYAYTAAYQTFGLI